MTVNQFLLLSLLIAGLNLVYSFVRAWWLDTSLSYWEDSDDPTATAKVQPYLDLKPMGFKSSISFIL